MSGSVGTSANRNLEGRVILEEVAVVGILVTVADLHNTLRKKLFNRVLHIGLAAFVANAGYHSVNYAVQFGGSNLFEIDR